MERRLHLIGWVLFLVCGILFVTSGVRNGDPWSIAASVVFTSGVVLFLVPLLPRRRG